MHSPSRHCKLGVQFELRKAANMNGLDARSFIIRSKRSVCQGDDCLNGTN